MRIQGLRAFVLSSWFGLAPALGALAGQGLAGCGQDGSASSAAPSRAEAEPSASPAEETPEASLGADVRREAIPGGIGSRVFVVERETESLAVYDLSSRSLLPQRIEGFGNMRHAIVAFSPDLRWGYVATRSGKLSRIDLQTLERAGDVFTSENSIDIAISQDGRFVATAEYAPGGVTILDAQSMEVVRRIPSERSRITGIVDAPGNRFVCVAMEGREVWIIDASDPEFPIERRIPVPEADPYDAMITPDGRYYVVGHLDSHRISVVDLRRPEAAVRVVSIAAPGSEADREAPVKLPHMASWAVAGAHIFVPLVGQASLAVLDRDSFEMVRSIELRGHPVYSVASPIGHEIWVSFSGESDDAFVQIIDTSSFEVKDEIEVGARIYHLDFTPRGAYVLVSANRANTLALIDATRREIVDRETLQSPSGVFGAWRAFRIGL